MRLRALSPSRLGTAALSLLLVCTALPSIPPAAAQSGTALSTLSLGDRMSLPAETMVRLLNGRTVSLGVLRAEHQARLARFAGAAALGLATGVFLKTQAMIVSPRSMGESARFRAGLVSNAHLVPAPSPAPSSGTVTVVPLAGWGTDGYAKDYLDFCSSASASACLYLPANTTYNYVFPQGSNAVTDTYNVADTDPLILDLQTCIAGGGSLYQGDGCVYRYPVNYFANFNPGAQPVKMGVSCYSPASYFIDPAGAVRVNYSPPGATFTTGGDLITCTLQISVTM